MLLFKFLFISVHFFTQLTGNMLIEHILKINEVKGLKKVYL